MAVKLLQVLVLGVIAAAAGDDVGVTWVPPPRASLPCVVPDARRIQARGPPPPLEGEGPSRSKYSWRRNGEEYKRVSNGGSLEVSRRKDASPDGVYQCAVRHQAGVVLGYPVHLRFAHLEKQFSVQPANASASAGQPYAFTCAISSGPPANITWIKDGEPLPKDNRFQVVNNQLIITKVQDEDAGLYRCRASNSLANKSRSSHGGRLQVAPGPPALPPAFLPVPHEASLEVPPGSRVLLPCPVIGNPRPPMLWEFTAPGDRTAELESTDDVLVIDAIAPDWAGIYDCKVQGHDLTKRFNVTVTSPVNITHPPESKKVVFASTVRFNCTASGVPAPEISWYKDGKPLKLEGRFTMVPSAEDKRLIQLLFRGVIAEDAGVYQCFAVNSVSSASAWAVLNVTGGAAAAPAGLSCAPAGARRVALRWSRLPDVVAYTVEYTGPDGESFPGQPVTEPEAVIQVKASLVPFSFRVRAYISSTGDKNTATIVSDMSDRVTCYGQGVPIKLSKLNNDTILVSWEEFSLENPGVMQWVLQQKAENSVREHNVTLEAGVHNYTLHVPPGESLQVRVLGSRSLPWVHQNLTLVPWTASSAASRYLQPGEVGVVPEHVEVTEISARNFTVRWRCCEDDGLPKAYTFVVCTRKLGGDENCIESSVKFAVVRGLQPASQYEVRVRALLPSRRQAGDFSAPRHVSTPLEGKEKFRNLTYKFVNATAVLVSWSSELGACTVRHTYEYELPLTHWASVEAEGNSALLTGLDPTKELKVLVEGQEPLARSQTLTVPVQIPEARDVQYSYAAGGVLVSWAGRGPRVVRYTQQLTSPMTTWPTIIVNGTSVLITGLSPTNNTFVVIAAPGESSQSHVLTVPPPPAAPADRYHLYLGVSVACGAAVLCAGAALVLCAWRRRKRSRAPRRARPAPADAPPAEEMTIIGDRLANGGGSKDAGEPLLNGHVHITENPTQSKTPNGKVRMAECYEDAFDVTRYDEADVTVETVLEADTSAGAYRPLDTARREPAPYRPLDPARREPAPCLPLDTARRDSFTKLPDDNMNSEEPRGTVALGNSKLLPTLQPNG